MMDLFEQPSTYSGIRLERLEFQNWGTFDGDIFVLPYEGRASLLIGNNGTGKTTLSDALLTLLVEKAKRNYNVSASSYGRKKGRNVASYVRGAYKETSASGEIHSKPSYLRPKDGTPTVLLAIFKNHNLGDFLSISQISYIQNGTDQTIYCYSESDKTIANDLNDFKDLRSIRPELRRRNFTVCDPIKQYFEKIRTWTGMRPQALDVFNQTVAVKEIENLNDFIRSYMLDAKDYSHQVQAITEHYNNLNAAYQKIIHADEQLKLLKPIIELGEKWGKLDEERKTAETLEPIRKYFFCNRKEQLYSEAIEDVLNKLNIDQNKIVSKKEKRKSRQDHLFSLRQEQNEKGSHLQTLDNQLQSLKTELQQKHDQRSRFFRALREMDIKDQVHSESELERVLSKIRNLKLKAPEACKEVRSKALDCDGKLRECRQHIDVESKELEQLKGRPSNIPRSLCELREKISNTLSIPLQRLPFAGELIQLKENESNWRLAAELVLHNFGLTLLVPDTFHSQVVHFAESTKLSDSSGKGLLLEYEKVSKNDEFGLGRMISEQPDLLAFKLDFKHDHEFSRWVKRETRERFQVRCIADTESFRRCREVAVSIQGQIQNASGRIRKDDREHSRDPRNFILGWDNELKRRALIESIRKNQQKIPDLEKHSKELHKQEDFWRSISIHSDLALQTQTWDELDSDKTELEIVSKQEERDAYLSQSDELQQLDQQIIEVENEMDVIDREIDQLNKNVQKFEDQKELWNNSKLLAEREKQKLPTPNFEALQSFEAQIKTHYLLDLETIEPDDIHSSERAQAERRKIEDKMVQLESTIGKAMTRFLSEFKADGFDEWLKAEIEYLGEFRTEYQRINGDRLPEFKEQFRKMARDRVQHELAQFHHDLRLARKDIQERIEEINHSLHEIEYNRNTYMRLLCENATHHERDELQRYLSFSLEDSLGHQRTFEEAEAFFQKIEPFLRKLLDDPTWSKRACDVRQWFNFAARECNIETDEEVRIYRSSATDSGGEKAKLAFTILAAALVYQYDIDPKSKNSNRFRLAVIDEAFAKVDDRYATYALELFEKFGFQLLIVAPFDPKARIVEPYVDFYVMTVKRQCDDGKDRSQLFTMTKEQFQRKIEET